MATALVVDDESEVRQVVTETLRRRGFSVLEARGIEESFRLANEYQGTIDLVIVNHLLADGIGRQAVERIARVRPEVKVLRYSGYPVEHLLKAGDLDPGVVFLQKPFRASELVDKVREVLGWLPEQRRKAGGGGA